MSSAKVLESKKKHVAELVEKLKSSSVGVIVSYKGIDVESDTKLRRDMRGIGVDYFVEKNTMLRFAFKELGYDFDEFLHGTTAVALSQGDVIPVAKMLAKYVKDLSESSDFFVKSGFVDGEVVTAEHINELGTLPTKEELLGMLLNVLTAPLRCLAIAIDAVAKKKSE